LELARAKAVAAAQFAMAAEAPAARAGSAAYELLAFDRLVSVEESARPYRRRNDCGRQARVAAEMLAGAALLRAWSVPKAGLAAAEAFVSDLS
jgi:hypothetical protein